jgi:hypothetical protein
VDLASLNPCTSTHNSGYSECQEVFGAIKLDNHWRFGQGPYSTGERRERRNRFVEPTCFDKSPGCRRSNKLFYMNILWWALQDSNLRLPPCESNNIRHNNNLQDPGGPLSPCKQSQA